MEPKPIYLIEQNNGELTIEEPPLPASARAYCCTPPAPTVWTVNPGLTLEIDTLRRLARTMGAANMAVLRRIEVPDLYFRRGLEYGQLRGADAGTLVLIRFDVHDSGAACEHWKF